MGHNHSGWSEKRKLTSPRVRGLRKEGAKGHIPTLHPEEIKNGPYTFAGVCITNKVYVFLFRQHVGVALVHPTCSSPCAPPCAEFKAYIVHSLLNINNNDPLYVLIFKCLQVQSRKTF